MAGLRLAACQLNTSVGDLQGNADRIIAALEAAGRAGADMAVFPELAVTGYPPEDLLKRPAFVADNRDAFARIARGSGSCAAAVGFVDVDRSGRLVNSVAVCVEGSVVARYGKRRLPNYGVFDEQRWFTPGEEPVDVTSHGGIPVGLSICEDLWFADGPAVALAAAGARLVVNVNASPYSMGRRGERLAMLRARVAETGCAVAYVNQVGGQDELVFDGASMVVDGHGELVASASQFAEEILLVDLVIDGGTVVAAGPGQVPIGSSGSPNGGAKPSAPLPPIVIGGRAAPLQADAEVYGALVMGTRDYLGKNGFTDAVLGLSGGVDSSLVATVAVDALGPGRVHGVTMPSRYSSTGSVADAVALATNLGIDITTVPIEDVHRAFGSMLQPLVGGAPEGLTDENLQSRIRGVTLMAVSNARGWIVLTTGNKSEMATGYSTLYGDSAGGFAVIKDVPKTLVYRLCQYRNRGAGYPLIPDNVLTKAPSAELRPGQRDDESLPPYDELDPVLAGYVEGDRSAEELIADGFSPAVVERVVALVDRAEYKRRQMPPGVRITTKAFGKDRRMPITNRYPSAPGPTVGAPPPPVGNPVEEVPFGV